MNNWLCIVGPTASGKSALALEVCARIGGEIVSCDSMQIYRGCDIATAKPTRREQDLVPHHLLDICDPDQRFSAAQWADSARKCAEEIESRGKTPIFCGGTGFYLRALLWPESLSKVAPNLELRNQLQLELETFGANEMHEKLAALDASAAARLHPNDSFRVLRALEIALDEKSDSTTVEAELTTGEVDSTKNEAPPNHEFAAQIFALDWPRAMLYERIDARVDAMIEAGFEAELRALCEKWGSDVPALGGVGYKQMLPVLRGEVRVEDGVDGWKRETRRYAKRQITYFSHQLPVSWLDAKRDLVELVEEIVAARAQ